MKTRRDRELIIWDGNRLGMPTQRQFHAAIQEIRGQRVMTVPGAALEMTPLMRVEEPDRGRAEIVNEIERRERLGRGRRGADNVLNAQAQLWWLDEWARPDGLYGLRELNEHEEERYEWFMAHVPLEGFTGAADRESIRGLPDAQIVCETLAIDGHLLLTHDPHTIKPLVLLPWTRALAEAGHITQPKVVEEADDANVRWCDETPEDMLLGTIVAAWPKETNAGPEGVRDAVDKMPNLLGPAGLANTARKLENLIDTSNELDALIERTHAALPVQMRNAERRSPYRSWTGAEEKPRGAPFRLAWTGTAMMLEHTSLNGTTHQWGSWQRDELTEMEGFLAERDIRVKGLPNPISGGSSAFGSAMNTTIEELEQARGIAD